MTYEELHKAVTEKKIISAKTKDKKKYRLFNSNNGLLGYFEKGKSRSGRVVPFTLFLTFETYQYSKELTEEQKTEKLENKTYNQIAKYRRMAHNAVGFTNDFIEDCKALPATKEEWIADGKKGLYDYRLTTGCSVDGVVVSVERISKKYRYIGIALNKAIAEQTTGSICRQVPFAGYEMSIETRKNENGTFQGWLSLEFKGCANGYYYLLINQGNFIGYDKD